MDASHHHRPLLTTNCTAPSLPQASPGICTDHSLTYSSLQTCMFDIQYFIIHFNLIYINMLHSSICSHYASDTVPICCVGHQTSLRSEPVERIGPCILALPVCVCVCEWFWLRRCGCEYLWASKCKVVSVSVWASKCIRVCDGACLFDFLCVCVCVTKSLLKNIRLTSVKNKSSLDECFEYAINAIISIIWNNYEIHVRTYCFLEKPMFL